MSRTSKEEIGVNAQRWGEHAKRDLPKDVGFVFIFFPKEGGTACMVSNTNQRRADDELKSILRRASEQRRIIIPGGD